ncbi:MAG: PEP/pyruvate-binding domain-containing protein [Thermodesulfobacteriota bacterium]|nr:PEP/pyruvate-binding domain-containing protein [Thermodesulfobacteriota bacterium]
MPARALEVNLASSRVNVTVDKRYEILHQVMGKYHGAREGLQTLLEEVCHPLKNWEFIVKETRAYALNYFHLLKAHPKGPEAARQYVDIFFEAVDSCKDKNVRANAADNLLFFIEKVIKGAGSDISGFLPVMDYGFDRIAAYPEETFSLFVRSFYQLNRLGKSFSQAVPPGHGFRAINRLLTRYFRYNYDYWIGQGDPLVWFENESGTSAEDKGLTEVFEPITHKRLKACQDRLESIVLSPDDSPETILYKLIELPGYGQIASMYGEVPQRLLSAGDDRGRGNQWKLIFLLHIMNIKGLSSIHGQTLRDINRTIAWLIRHEDALLVQRSLENTFAILELNKERFPETAVNCVWNMGQGVYKTDESDLIDFFLDAVISLGFQAPEIRGVTDDWQIQANPAHIQNIRTWLQLIELNPKWSKKLLSSLIIHLSLSGVFIKDTDLFSRDITKFLNSDITPVYNLTKQLMRLFPAYFSDIGAEGNLRDVSTRIDEICLRKDPLTHFLRKQSHVESSNQIIGLMEATLNYWKTKNKEGIRAFVPPSIYDLIETEGPYVDGVNRVVERIFEVRGLTDAAGLLNLKGESLRELVGDMAGVSDRDLDRVALMIEFYGHLYQKYHVDFKQIDGYLAQLQPSKLPDPARLREALGEENSRQKLIKLLSYLQKLKKIITSPERYEVREDIYRKRHFAVDIPSMYGSYHEAKFDALGLTFRLESLANVLFEEIVESIDLELITRATFSQIYQHLQLFNWALTLDGISSLEMARQLDLLAHSIKARGFSSTQYMDIFRGFSEAVNNIVNDHFNNIHGENLLTILNQLPTESLMPKYLPRYVAEDRERLVHMATEIFLRDRIASSLGLQQLDLFLSRILNTLYRQSHELPKERLRLLLSYDPQKVVTSLETPKKGISDIIHLGNKGLNLVRMKDLGLPIPPGFIITTEVFRCREIVKDYPPANKNFREQVAHEVGTLEKLTGKHLGDPHNPLLLSVRSGSSISQPGMMNTFLDVGINEKIVQGLAVRTGNDWFSWDTFRRFLQSYGMAFGLLRDEFDAVIGEFKKRSGIPYKRDFSGQQMKEVALAYKSLIQDRGIEIEESPFEQLHIAIREVFDSWHAPKAETYRKIMGISDDWGTAVTVQAMVFGNFSQKSGSGVFFTHNPRWSGDMLTLWGDFTPGNQGEDVVSGLVRTHPISRKQAEIENRDSETTLESRFPGIYQAMRKWAKELVYEREWSPQEMEFTFEAPNAKSLYCLQTRDMVMRERKKVYSFDVAPETPVDLLGHGIGVSGGAMKGKIVFSIEEIRYWRNTEPEALLILIRGDTVPDDIREIHEADGLLTARGGSTSHAAITAHRLGKTCVVGCSDLVCMEKERACSFNQQTLKSGDWISIDGLEGSVYSGQMRIREIERD